MRLIVLAMLLASCGPKAAPHDEFMASSTLDRQDPKAKYEHHDPPSASSHWWNNFHPFGGGPSDSFANPTNPPHYYTGCGGCSSGSPVNALLVLALIPAFARRRNVRAPRATPRQR